MVEKALHPELLAPAGCFEAIRAAAANGADAVYFGLDDFNARRRAVNFSLRELPEVMGYLHQRNVKGYVTFNTLIFSPELDKAADFARAIAAAGADAVIVQDLGLAAMIRRMAPALPIHASTQMTLTEAGGIELARTLGVSRVILARELSLEEIGLLARPRDQGGCGMELEVFVHGAMCISYSGQCLASESLWGRSANRGLCAQACRLPYELIVDGRKRDGGDRKYLLSAQDLAAYDRIGELVKLGVRGFKIEGRLKSAQYVAAAVQMYRAAIDAALAGVKFEPSPRQELELVQSFSRGSGHGFLEGPDHQGLVHGLFARHLGVRVGTVAGTTRRGVIVQLDDRAGSAEPGGPLEAGDGVVFDDDQPQHLQQGGRIYAVDPYFPQERPSRRPPRSGRPRPPTARAGSPRHKEGRRFVELKFRGDDVNLAAVAAGSVVWRTDDPKLRRQLKQTYSRDEVFRRVPVSVHVRGQVGGELEVTVADDAGRTAVARWAGPLEAAQKHPLTVELVRRQFQRLGDTPFELAAVELLGAAGPADELPVMAPKSVLNDLRRQAVEKLVQLRQAATRYEIAEPQALEELRRHFRFSISDLRSPETNGKAAMDGPTENRESKIANLLVLVRTPEQLAAVLHWRPGEGLSRPSMVYCDFDDLALCRDAVAAGKEAGLAVALATPRILKPREMSLLEQIADAGPQAVLVRNLGSLEFLRRRGPDLPLVGDYGLNVANELTAGVLIAAGLARVTASHDLNWRQMAAMISAVGAGVFEVVVHHPMPLFHMEHCVFAARLSQGRDERTCGRPCRRHKVQLRDRNGISHALTRDAACRNTLYHAVAQSAAEYLEPMRSAGVGHFRIELLAQTPAQVGPLLECYGGVLAGLAKGDEAFGEVRRLTGAGATRGTLELE